MADPQRNYLVVKTGEVRGCKTAYVDGLSQQWVLNMTWRLSRIPSVRKAHRQMRNGHTQSVACKPAFRGRRRDW